ncbi:MAG TPA: DinB family protein [bacterium]|jgi:uncharacterized damage-inducible protein DinB
MNKQTLDREWKYFYMVLGVSRKLVDQIPEDKMDFRPTPEVRSAMELITHAFNFLAESVETVTAGRHIDHKEPTFDSKAALMTWMDVQVAEAFAGFAKLTDKQLEAKIEAWGETFSGWQMLDFAYQEHLHHRGQLTVYLRLMGIEPVFIYDFSEQH